MAQRSIMSYFNKSPAVKKENRRSSDQPNVEDECDKETERSCLDSPVRKITSKKRPRLIQSDSEDENQLLNDSPVKKVKEDSSLNSKEGLLDKHVEEKETENDSSCLNEDNEKKVKSPIVQLKGSPKDSPKEKEKKIKKASKLNKKSKKQVEEKAKKNKTIKSSIESGESDTPTSQNHNSPNGHHELTQNGLTSEQTQSIDKSKIRKDEAISSDETSHLKPSPKKNVNSFFTVGKKNEALSNSSSYCPNKFKYNPIDDASWKHGDKVPYMALAKTFEKIEEVSSRLKMVEILSNYLRSVIVLSPDDLLASVYLCLNKLAPAYHGIELGIADTSLIKAIAQSTGRSSQQIKSEVGTLGDLGLVAEQSKTSQRMMFNPPPLTVSTVFSKLKDIAQMTGHASQNKKVDKIQSMFVACKGPEARYLIRSLAGKLRIGLAEQSVLQAISQACILTPPAQDYPPKVLDKLKGLSTDKTKSVLEEGALILKTTYCECPNFDLIIPTIVTKGLEELPNYCKLTPGVPLKPMLAHPTKGIHEVLHRFEGLKFTCEWKYDGERAQIHLAEDGKVSIYSRNQEDNTSKYPDVISRLKTVLSGSVKSCILDTETVAWDIEKKQIRPFQVLTTRKRKDASESEIKVQVCVFMFDLLYFNGEPLVKEPFAKRRQLLKDNFNHVEGQWHFAESLDTNAMDDVHQFLEQSVKGNCEGLMVKTLEEEATYEIAKRSRNWLKLKKDYMDGVGDSIDVVVIGGYLGKGKRTGLYGGFLLACYDPDNEEYQSLCKIGTGFSDEDLQKHSEFLKSHLLDSVKPYYRFDSSHEPDHWFEPVQVWEIKCADLSLSPVHRAALGIVDPVKGISLRFPRFLRIREDKSVDDATSAHQIADMYQNQEQIKNQQVDNKVNEEDFY